MKEAKGFIAGVLVSLLFFYPVISLAEAVSENITVYSNYVNISINGTPQKIDNFIYKNTTYVPLKAISAAFGKKLTWDSKTNTADINDAGPAAGGRGNSIGNTVNGSYVAFEGEWVYYINHKDGSKIYKMKKDGSSKTKIYNNSSGGLNVVDGWLYFNSYDDEDLYMNMYKMRTDGSDRIKLSGYHPAFINVVDNWIYYSNNGDYEKIYKMKIDGSCITKLSNELSRDIIVHDGWIYYLELKYNTKVDDVTLYKIRTDGSERTKLSDDLVRDTNIEDDWIYYINYHVYPQGGIALYKPDEIYKIRLDGSEKTRVVSEDVKCMNVTNGWIYYTTESQLCKVRTDGSMKAILLDEIYRIRSLYVIEDYLYYLQDSELGYKLYRMKPDATSKEQLY